MSYLEFNINEFAQEVHDNAVSHGWWETERELYEVLALIHAEWSEALEEDRAGRPMVWHECEDGTFEKLVICENCPECYYSKNVGACVYLNKKPEGVAVELIDGVIRILDYCGRKGIKIPKDLEEYEWYLESWDIPVSKVVSMLHSNIVYSYAYYDDADGDDEMHEGYLFMAIASVFRWIKEKGLDPVKIMKDKHEYNRTRPYKHNKHY